MGYSPWGLKESDATECARVRTRTHTHTPCRNHFRSLTHFSLNVFILDEREEEEVALYLSGTLSHGIPDSIEQLSCN